MSIETGGEQGARRLRGHAHPASMTATAAACGSCARTAAVIGVGPAAQGRPDAHRLPTRPGAPRTSARPCSVGRARAARPPRRGPVEVDPQVGEPWMPSSMRRTCTRSLRHQEEAEPRLPPYLAGSSASTSSTSPQPLVMKRLAPGSSSRPPVLRHPEWSACARRRGRCRRRPVSTMAPESLPADYGRQDPRP